MFVLCFGCFGCVSNNENTNSNNTSQNNQQNNQGNNQNTQDNNQIIVKIQNILNKIRTYLQNDGEYDDSGFITIDEVVAYADAYAASLSSSENKTNNYEKTGTANFDVPATGFDVNTPVTITFLHTMSRATLQPVLTKYIEKFKRLYPNITVVDTIGGGFDDVKETISNQLNTGGEPNIAYCYTDHVASYLASEKVVTLDNLIDSKVEITRKDGSKEIIGLTDDQKSDYIEGFYNEGRQFGDGLMYTMPFSKSTEVLYYNKTFFDNNNIELPTHWFSKDANDTTSMEYVVKKIKSIDPNSIPLGYDDEANWFITMCEQCGSPYTSATGDHYLFNESVNKSLWYEFRKWYQDGLVTTQKLNGSYTSTLFISDGTNSRRSYMTISSSAWAAFHRPERFYGEYPFEVGITEIPQMNENNKKVISRGPSVCIFKKSNPQEVIASWLFVKYLTSSVEFQIEFSNASGYLPVIKSVLNNDVYKTLLEKADGGDYIVYLSFKVCLSQTDNYFTSPAFLGSSNARNRVNQLVEKIFANMSKSSEKEIQTAISREFDEAIESLNNQH